MHPIQTMLKQTFKPGIRYHKCGVFLQELMPAGSVQTDLFALPDNERTNTLLKTIDSLNHRFGRNSLKFASDGFGNSWMTQANLKSPSYTTKWNEILSARST